MPGWKKTGNQRWRPRNGCDNSSMAKILITTIQVNLCVLLQVSLGLGTKFTWIVVIKIFAIELLSQPFLGRHLWFHVFFHPGILGPHPFFTACCFCIDITSFCNCIFISFGAFYLSFPLLKEGWASYYEKDAAFKIWLFSVVSFTYFLYILVFTSICNCILTNWTYQYLMTFNLAELSAWWLLN